MGGAAARLVVPSPPQATGGSQPFPLRDASQRAPEMPGRLVWKVEGGQAAGFLEQPEGLGQQLGQPQGRAPGLASQGLTGSERTAS